MTDKTVNCGTKFCTYYADDDNCIGHTDENDGVCPGAVPSSGACKNSNSCFSVYHSCVDIKINGDVCMNHFRGGDIQDKDWPYKNNSSHGYTSESATWENGWLVGVPKKFTNAKGINLCKSKFTVDS